MAENIARTVQIGARVRPEIADWLRSSQNTSDFLNEILEKTFAGNIPKHENTVFIHLTPEQLRELDTLLEENPELKTYENILQSALAHYVFNGLTFGLNENDDRILTPEREVEIRAQFQTLLDENINPLKDEIIQLKLENKRLQDENNVFRNHENISAEPENIENNPVFIQLKSENIALQNENKRLMDENNVFKNHENITTEFENIENNSVFIQLQSENIALQDENKRLLDENNVFKNPENITTEPENIENNPVFIRLQNENKALQLENIRLRDENNENTMLDKFKAFKLANDAGLNNLIAEAVRFSEQKAFVRIGAGVWKKHYTKGFEEISQP
ncbi:hypothetical protein [Flectobacillus roseus]|uniref:Uncharacterized protein n=1 Tax=Flectobacillus roseus TaxID=502259 RepID=A0ABT6Y2X1_9BACT|nr:hypothetical protein [Flectobacillus roseus]MDI9857914.1 hypothetical protein [Flectobacillus roseus]